MNKKAFTLVELLGVIVILGILGLVIIPKVGDSITNSQEQSYKAQETTIKKATNDFLMDNTDLLETNNTVTIKLGVLKQKGYLPVNIKNPKTHENFSNESRIVIEKKNENYDISLFLFDLEDVSENVNSNSPILVLNGNYIEYIEVNGRYIEKGAIAKDNNGATINNVSTQIKINGIEKSNIDTTQLATYNVIYSVTDSNGYTSTATRTVIIRDTQPPIITFPKNTIISTNEVSTFDVMQDVRVSDNYTANPNIQVNSSIASLPGKYVITYIATDSNGNETVERRVITVDDSFSEHYTKLDYIESTGLQYIMTDITPTDNMGVMIKASSNDITSDTIYLGSTGIGDTRLWIGNVNSNIYYGWNSITEPESRPSITSGSINEMKMNYLNDRKTIFNGNVIDQNLTTLGNNSYPITIFAGNLEGTVNYKSKIKIYRVVITEGNEITHELIPYYRNSDREAGLFDTVTNKFYTNSGTSAFIKGELQ